MEKCPPAARDTRNGLEKDICSEAYGLSRYAKVLSKQAGVFVNLGLMNPRRVWATAGGETSPAMSCRAGERVVSRQRSLCGATAVCRTQLSPVGAVRPGPPAAGTAAWIPPPDGWRAKRPTPPT